MEHIKTGMIFPEKNEYNILQALTITVGASFLDVRLAAHVSKGLKSRIRPVVGRI